MTCNDEICPARLPASMHGKNAKLRIASRNGAGAMINSTPAEKKTNQSYVNVDLGMLFGGYKKGFPP